jgi:hypothetical protein
LEGVWENKISSPSGQTSKVERIEQPAQLRVNNMLKLALCLQTLGSAVNNTNRNSVSVQKMPVQVTVLFFTIGTIRVLVLVGKRRRTSPGRCSISLQSIEKRPSVVTDFVLAYGGVVRC